MNYAKLPNNKYKKVMVAITYNSKFFNFILKYLKLSFWFRN